MLICNESSEKSRCDDYSNKKRFSDCKTMKTDFYSYKNGKMYKNCKECYIKKVRCGFCNKELNKSYLRSHIKKQHNQQSNQQHNNQQHHNQQYYNQQHYIQYIEKQHNKQQHNNNGASEGASNGASIGASEINSTLRFGPSFCGKTYLLLNKLQLIRLFDPLRQICVITRRPEQYKDLQLDDVSVEEMWGIWKCIVGVV